MKVDLSKVSAKNKRAKQVRLPQPKNPDRLEEELHKMLNGMAAAIRKRFENQVLKKLTKADIKKFHDGYIEMKDATYSATFKKLVANFEKSIKKQFSEARIKRYISKLYKKTHGYNTRTSYRTIDDKFAVDIASVLKTDGLNTFVTAKTLETTGQIIKTKTEMMEGMSQNAIRLMNAGKSLTTLYEEVAIQNKKNLGKSELVARNVLKAFNTQLSKKRAENLGAKKAIWRTAGGSKVRECHRVRDGKEYEIGVGLYSSCDGLTLEVGESVNCRCVAEYIIDL